MAHLKPLLLSIFYLFCIYHPHVYVEHLTPLSYSDALRMELAPFGIKVIIVKPGAVKSNIANSRAHTLDRYDSYLIMLGFSNY
jgi:hypothetical protein